MNAAAVTASSASTEREEHYASWLRGARTAATLGLDRVVETQYLECRLGPARGQVDYLCSLSRERARPVERALVAHLERAGAGADPRWVNLLRVLDAWDSGASCLCERVPVVWLEFDDLTAGAAGVPSVSACLVPGYRVDRPVSAGIPERDVRATVDVLGALGVEVDAPLEATLSSCFTNLPSRARWIHASVMWGRTPRAIKLYGKLERRDLLGYLAAIGWAGDLSAIEALLACAYAPALVGDELFVDLSLENFRARERCSLGLAVSQQHWIHGGDADRGRSAVLEAWRDLGVVTEADEAALVDWQRANDGDAQQAFLDFKLVWQATAKTIAKAYLGTHRAFARLELAPRSTSARASRKSGGSFAL